MKEHVLILATTNNFLLRFEYDNLKLLLGMGYTVHYAANLLEPVYTDDRLKLHAMGVRLHHIDIARSPYMLKANLKALFELKRIIEKYNIKIIHCHTPVGGVLGRLSARLTGKTKRPVVIYTAHGFHFYKGAPLYNRLVFYSAERALAHFTDILIVINSEDLAAAKRLRLKKGASVYKIDGVGVNLKKYKPQSDKLRCRLRRVLGLRPGDFFILSVGELNHNKNHTDMLLALKLLKDEGSLENIKYGIVGDGFLKWQLVSKIKELGLYSTVPLYGSRLSPRAFLAAADAMAFVSKREGLGMAALEALAMGVPVIATDNRGTREYMQDGQNGFVVPLGDTAALAKSILTLKNLSADKLFKMKSCAAETALKFDTLVTRECMKRVYNDAQNRIKG